MPNENTSSVALENLGTEQAMKSLMSEVCPSCGGVKKARRSLCIQCYRELPKRLKDALFLPMMGGYERALTEALRHLGSGCACVTATQTSPDNVQRAEGK